MNLLTEEEIFAAVVEKPPAERASFLDRVCGGDPTLRVEIEALLKAHEHPDSLLVEGPCTAIDSEPRPAECPGTKIGYYKLLQQIGDGGFGVVYMAEQQEPVRRNVALKIIKPGMDTKEVIARFESERQALALMDHLNIAKVLDAGATLSGRPYFVMELVKGIPLTQFCDSNHLPPEERLELFIQVCNALQHAHQKGIIHRDLKPSNVMVTLHDGRPVPKVIDFGVAKATSQRLTERTLFTAYGQMIGTPAYMSPEQAEMSGLDIDIRSDIYSLGVLLYELLTGTTPFESRRLREAGFAEMQRIIREEDPPRPSTRVSTLQGQALTTLSQQQGTDQRRLRQFLRGELDWIVMKALEKDRECRYESASSFARDIRRYLSDEPVQACPPSAWYRLRKLARRNKVALSMAAVVLTFLMLLGGGAGWLVRDQQARQARLVGQVGLILSEVEQRELEREWDEAIAAARRAEALLAAGGPDPDLERRTRAVLADLTLVERLEQIRQERVAPREEETRQAWANRAYVTAFRERGIELDRLTLQEAAFELRSRTHQALTLAAALDDWADCRRAMQDETGAQRLREIAQQADPDPWRRKVRDAIKQKDGQALEALAAVTDLAQQEPRTLLLLGSGLCAGGHVEHGVAVLRKAQWQAPGDFMANHLLGYWLIALGPEHWEDGVGFFRAAAAVQPHGPGNWHHLGRTLARQGKYDEAVECLTRSIALSPKVARAHLDLGNYLVKQNKLDEAIACLHQAIELDPQYASAHHSLGMALSTQGRIEEAILSHWKAIELSPAMAGTSRELFNAIRNQPNRDKTIAFFRKVIADHPENALAHWFLGNALWYQGNIADSLEPFQRASELAPSDARPHHSRANVLCALGRLKEAIDAYQKAIELVPQNEQTAEMHRELGVALQRHGQIEEAIAHWKKSVEINPQYARGHTSLAWTFATAADSKLRDPLAAVAHAQAAVDLAPEDANHWSNLGVALWRNGECQSAIEKLEKANQMASGGDNYHRFFLAMAYWQSGEREKARQAYEQGVLWMSTNRPNVEELKHFRAEAEELMKNEITSDP